MNDDRSTDLLIAGGGLAGGLIALALARHRPGLDLTIVEAAPQLGGNHVWSFFDSDLSAAGRALVAPLVCHSWPRHDVAFPALRRTLDGRYNSIESDRLDAVVRAAVPGAAVLAGCAIAALDPGGATLADGRRIAAKGVIDVRGGADWSALDLGWQKFVGRLLRLDAPHGLERPMIMDATVEQAPGYRFVYLLPFDAERVFVEDTYYTTTPELDVAAIGDRVLAYAATRGWTVAAIEREEAAVLPIAMGGDFDRLWPVSDRLARAGMAAGLFQPLTGYSLPDAVRTALLVADQADLSSAMLALTLRRHARAAWQNGGYYRLLARMLFRAADPPERFRVLQRFYGLDAALIARIYAGRSTLADKARILIGKPPVPLHRALRTLRET